VASAGLGVPLGAVFPKIVAQAGAADPRLVSWAWAINGAASVIGSILAVALTINVGFTTVGVVAAVCYLVPVIAGRAQRLRPRGQTMSERSVATS
jgi:ABC-type Mn2+/Zn2+ transport system permease subunit